MLIDTIIMPHVCPEPEDGRRPYFTRHQNGQIRIVCSTCGHESFPPEKGCPNYENRRVGYNRLLGRINRCTTSTGEFLYVA